MIFRVQDNIYELMFLHSVNGCFLSAVLGGKQNDDVART